MFDKARALLFYVLPHHAISGVMFWLARIEWRPVKNLSISLYTKLNRVNMQEAIEQDKYAYPSLNAFFTRALKPEARPYDPDERNWLCPVDGTVSHAGKINHGQVFQAKGRDYSLLELLAGDTELEQRFSKGSFATLYLSPRDYHRIHMPVTGKLKHMQYVPGRLFSVAPFTVNHIPRLFARNERLICYFETDQGPMALILVGAINVSATETVWHGLVTSEAKKLKRYDYNDREIAINRGEEMGRFNLGSTVIVLMDDNMNLSDTISAGMDIRLGQPLARPTTSPDA
jgi:phosphatidylserine decarboxylase